MMDAAGERKDKEDIMRTIAIINLKGGVAKTTSSINIAYILTQRGFAEHPPDVSERSH